MLFRLLFLGLLFFQTTKSIGQVALNIDLLGQFNRGDIRYSGCWGYTDAEGKEYALLGTRSGLAIYTIDDVIEELDFVSGPQSNWREVMVFGNYAYVTTEGATDTTGMQILDLQYLPDSIALVTTYQTTFTQGHTVQRDIYSDAPYLYISGTAETSGVHILDISDPESPLEVGLYDPGYYIHDCFIKGELLFAAAFFESTLDIIDISDRTNPILIAQLDHIDGNTHSCWLTEDNRYLMVTSELDGNPSRMYHIEDFDNIEEVARYTANNQTLVHNPYTLGNYIFISHNAEGLRVLDVHDPEVPVEVAYYDTYAESGGGSFGLWSAYPYFSSGKIIGGDRQQGLFVWTFNQAKAGRAYITVRDSETQEVIPFVEAVILETGDTLQTDVNGQIKWGALPGSYTLFIDLEDRLAEFLTIDIAVCDSLNLAVFLEKDMLDTNTEIYENTVLKLFPNPAKEVVYVEAARIEEGSSLTFYNHLGQVVLTKSIRTDLESKIDCSALSKGMYYVVLKNKSNQIIAYTELMLVP